MKRAMRAASLAAALLAVACIKDTTGPVQELTENRGTQLPAGEKVSLLLEFAWSADGSGIFYQPDVADPELKLVAVAAGTPRKVDGPRDEYVDLRAGPDGSLYFVADVGTDGRRTVYRLNPARDSVISLGRTRGGAGGRPADGVLVLPSPVPGFAGVLVAPDSIYLAGPEGRTFIASGCERLVAFSPDGASLLCRRGGGPTVLFSIVDLEARQLRGVTLLGPGEGTPQMIRWDATGIKVLFFDFGGYFLRDVSAAETRQVWAVPRTGAVMDFDNTAWSSDGRHFAFWVHACLERTNIASCRRGQSALHVVNTTTLEDRVVAVGKGQVGGQFMAFSPDGSRIAYVFENAIYHVPVL